QQITTARIIALLFSFRRKILHKNRECASVVLLQAKSVIKLQTGQAPSRLPGVKGAGSPLAQSLSALSGRAAPWLIGSLLLSLSSLSNKKSRRINPAAVS
ncbi:MAG: hypothetical protein ACI4J4_02760, partial [Ruminiclostridium sp.]